MNARKILKKGLSSFFILQILFPGWVQAIAENTHNNLPYQKGSIIVQYKKNKFNLQNEDSLGLLKEKLHSENKKIINTINEKNIVLIEKNNNFLEGFFRSVNGFSMQESTEDLINQYKNDPNIEFVQPNFIYKIENEISNITNTNQEGDIHEKIDNQDATSYSAVSSSTEEGNTNGEVKNTHHTENIEETKELETENNKIHTLITEEEVEETKNDEIENNNTHENLNPTSDGEMENSENTNESITNENNNRNEDESDNEDENHKENKDDPVLFDDPLYSKQWYLKNNGERISGMDNYYRNLAEKILPEDTEDREEKIQKIISTFTNSTKNIDIEYEKALKIYNKARERLSEAQKQKKITVAIIDDGVNYNLEEFSGKMWNGENCKSTDGEELGGCIHGYNVATNEKNGINHNENFHGTHIASLIVGESNNNEGIVGIAPDAEIMAINIQQENGDITTYDLIKGINFAQANDADIINLSIGSVNPVNINNISIFDTLTYTTMREFPGLIINAVGNSSTNIDDNTSVNFPSIFSRSFVVNNIRYDALPNLVVVGSIQQDGKHSWFSNYGINTVNILAPGSNIISAGRETEGSNTDLERSNYDMVSGTSFAAPIVLASLVFAKSAYPERDWSDIKNIMEETSVVDEIYKTRVKNSGRLSLGNMMERLEFEYKPAEPLHAEITSNNTQWTNNDITLTLASNKDIDTPIGWEKLSQRIFQKNISSNQIVNTRIVANEETLDITHTVENIDKTLPTSRILNTQNLIINNKNFQLEFEGEDGESGIKHFECKTGTKNWTTCQSPIVINFQNEGQHYIFVRAIDNANNIGNESSIIIEYKKQDTETREVSQNTTTSNANQHDNKPNQSHKSGSSGSGGGGYVPMPHKIQENYRIPTLISPEENQSFSSAPQINKEQYPQNIEQIKNTLKQEWIKNEQSNSTIKFSQARKLHWIQKIFHTYINNPQPSISQEWIASMIEIHQKLIKNILQTYEK